MRISKRERIIEKVLLSLIGVAIFALMIYIIARSAS